MGISKINSTENITKALNATNFLDKDPDKDNVLEVVGTNVAHMGAALGQIPGVGFLAGLAVSAVGVVFNIAGGMSGGGGQQGGRGPSG
jgi:hypothetical protein